MDPAIIDHLKNIPLAPAIDVLGQWVCCANGKTASTSMIGGKFGDRQILQRRGRRNWNAVWEQVIVPRIDSLLLFTFVRNPWDKVVSAFHFLQQSGKIQDHWTFGDYVKQVLAKEWPDGDKHFRLQSPSFLFDGHLIPGMFVGRFERLERDWAYVAGVLGVSSTLAHRNRSKHEPYADCYDDESREIVRTIYHVEIDALGYEFGQ